MTREHTVADAAALMDRCEIQVRRYLREGSLRGIKRGGVWVIPAPAIEAWLAGRSPAPQADPVSLRSVVKELRLLNVMVRELKQAVSDLAQALEG